MHWSEELSTLEPAAKSEALAKCVAALLALEWRAHGRCPDCDFDRSCEGHYEPCRSNPGCRIDAALTAAGLPDQASRDAAREKLR